MTVHRGEGGDVCVYTMSRECPNVLTQWFMEINRLCYYHYHSLLMSEESDNFAGKNWKPVFQGQFTTCECHPPPLHPASLQQNILDDKEDSSWIHESVGSDGGLMPNLVSGIDDAALSKLWIGLVCLRIPRRLRLRFDHNYIDWIIWASSDMYGVWRWFQRCLFLGGRQSVKQILDLVIIALVFIPFNLYTGCQFIHHC